MWDIVPHIELNGKPTMNTAPQRSPARPDQPGANPAAAPSTLAPRVALGFALVGLLMACGGGGSDTTPPAAREGALAASRPGELVQFVRARLRAREAQALATPGLPLSAGLATDVAATAGAAPPARSTTLVQEAGVDESDLLLSDGRHLYALQPEAGTGGRIAVHRRADNGGLSMLATLRLSADGASEVSTSGMVMSDDQRRLAVLSQRWLMTEEPARCTVAGVCNPIGGTPVAPLWLRSSVGIDRIDVSDPAAARVLDRVQIDGHLVDSRRIGNRLYVVSVHRPWLAYEALAANASEAERAALLDQLRAADLLPTMRINGGAAQPLVGETDCYLQIDNKSLAVEITTVSVFDLAAATATATSRCFVGGSEGLYMSSASLYVATTRFEWQLGQLNGGLSFAPAEMKTDIHKFALAAAAINYRGSASVDGHLGWDTQRKSYRMSELGGDLRVLTFSGQFGWFTTADSNNPAIPPSPAKLTILRERSGTDTGLHLVSTLPNAARPAPLGKPGEQVYAVRFVGNRGYVVTFRTIDPLYVLDLSDPADPKTAGELEVPGFSNALVPLGEGLLLGIGRDISAASGRVAGVKIALFDVLDAARPREIRSITLGDEGSGSTIEHSMHGLNLLQQGAITRLALPVHLQSAQSAQNAQDAAPARHGLQTFEVDTQARTLSLRALRGESPNLSPSDLWLERSLQIGDHVYYLHQGALLGYAW